MNDIIARDKATGRFLAGNSGNGGRKPGSRNRHGETFISAFASDFEAHGTAIIEQVRIEQPAIYLKIASDLLPKEIGEKFAGYNPFAPCESLGEIMGVLLKEMTIDEALNECDAFRAELMRIASDGAEPVN